MSIQPLRRYAPRSLYTRAALILLVPVVGIQLVVSIVFIQRHYEDVTRQMTAGVVLELAHLVEVIEAAPDRDAAVAAAGPLARALAILPTLPDPDPLALDRRDAWDLSGRTVIATLHARLPALQAVDLAARRKRVVATVATRHGQLELDFDRGRVSASNPHQLLVLMIGTSIMMSLIAALFLANQVRPIRQLARAAEAFGKGRTLPYRPRGATEVQAAGHAFLDMRARIERHIDQRTLMLSGVSHDLRTPITRLRLAIAMMEPSGETAAMEADLDDMEAMLDAFLDFCRTDMPGETVVTDPARLAAQVVEAARRAGHGVTLRAPQGTGTVAMRPAAIARALGNLIGNAARHGTRIELGCSVGDRTVVFTVEDDGPGIAAQDREAALRPFVRLDPARNHNRSDAGRGGFGLGGGGLGGGGRGRSVGLGLAIAIDIAREHGGTLRLGDSAALGGLKADLVVAR